MPKSILVIQKYESLDALDFHEGKTHSFLLCDGDKNAKIENIDSAPIFRLLIHFVFNNLLHTRRQVEVALRVELQWLKLVPNTDFKNP